ncbi:MAG: Zn-binding domain-containing protein [Gammaproteobacteria bacterium]|nr:Zn-binding domain-containing protein [Gammaproteobacteria bacterium]
MSVVDIPLYDNPFGGVTDDLDRIRRGREWLAAQIAIEELREEGLWSDLNDRAIELAPYFTAAEHSAQQDSRTLQRYEKAFKLGDLNLLSCSTTMEMGIDIGGISQVAMNNVPPHPANYLQRVGRAGRRNEARSVSMTLCKSNPHDQAVFSNSRWAFDTSLAVPGVSLDSSAIVQRHAQSMMLSHFLSKILVASGQEQTSLTCGMFYLGEDPLAVRFSSWCRGFSRKTHASLADGLERLVKSTIYEGWDLSRITNEAARRMDELAQRWRLEWQHLDKTEGEVLQSLGEKSPAARAVAFHKARMTGEYLLREAASHGFLPGYGFPTHIAHFDNLTRGQFVRSVQREGQGREDNRYRRREMANRDLTTALRDYAPGSEVVMDGLVYRSAGVTLNWHIPADNMEAREVQDIRHAWRCKYCGASGSTHSWAAAHQCAECGAAIAVENIREFLEPAGFAVDFHKEPSNDISTQHFVPVERPWIDADGNWIYLANPDRGRFRVSARGHIFHQSRGVNGTGYALCLECGRAEPMSAEGKLPAIFTKAHHKLRRTRKDNYYCPGSDNDWKARTGITLGHEVWTDVLELQFKTIYGTWLNDETVALTLSVAVRGALADLLGVQASELDCDIKPARPEPGAHCQSILVFDRYAAGYAASAEKHLDSLFHIARRRLDCPAHCDSACPHCILDFDQRFAADRLNRHAALELLTDEWLTSLQLPERLAYFGAASQADCQRLPEALWSTVARQGVRGLRVFTGGCPEAWDIGPSPLREMIYRLAAQEIAVEIMIPGNLIGDIEEADRYLLASLADHPRVTLKKVPAVPRAGDGWLVAEVFGKSPMTWAFEKEEALVFGPAWGTFEGVLVKAAIPAPVAHPDKEFSPEAQGSPHFLISKMTCNLLI